ncbi:MAG: hypothetical protein ACPGUV_09065, partial [Polyangiales bacterium]
MTVRLGVRCHGGLKPKVERLLALIERDPWAQPPAYEGLVGDLRGRRARRAAGVIGHFLDDRPGDRGAVGGAAV